MCGSLTYFIRLFRTLDKQYVLDYKLGDGMISSAFKLKGVYHFEAACEWVKGLSYGRNLNKKDPLIVLKELRGTCSSKHALIKRLADEIGISDLKLMLCIFKMSASNTPKVQPILEEYGLEYIPEAHNYLKLDGRVLDLTFSGEANHSFLNDVLYEEEIEAEQIIGYKLAFHKKYLSDYVKENSIGYSLVELWDIREACIKVLS